MSDDYVHAFSGELTEAERRRARLVAIDGYCEPVTADLLLRVLDGLQRL